jgi:hypothetical protein
VSGYYVTKVKGMQAWAKETELTDMNSPALTGLQYVECHCDDAYTR